ncbi:BQ5605_C001g00899 [Microbotryum silenes-dioicae]|uniref:BQ5605_C001g00899 protein n=1 Tax=Microbotryum silenes-dioicae TaxID=796604 RepID=A0A2X0M7W3_9BASI|nr:BQ5605_C001g00899 [Microbotryum silenes-dioicae]
MHRSVRKRARSPGPVRLPPSMLHCTARALPPFTCYDESEDDEDQWAGEDEGLALDNKSERSGYMEVERENLDDDDDEDGPHQGGGRGDGMNQVAAFKASVCAECLIVPLAEDPGKLIRSGQE